MPDLLTHLIIGLVLIEIFNVRKMSLVLLGTIMPDLLLKLVLLRLFIRIPNINYGVLSAFHTPFVLFLVSLLIAPLFRYDYKKVVLWLNLGALSHFLADATLKHLSETGVRLFYPLSYNTYTLSLIWPNHSYLLMMFFLLVYIAIFLFKSQKRFIYANI